MNDTKQFLGTWQVTKKEKKNAQNQWQDSTKSCDLDDREEYQNMGKWYFDPGEMRCQPTDVLTTGTWDYDANEKRLVFGNGQSNTAEAIVQTITSDKMVLILNTGTAGDSTRISYKRP